MKMVVIGLFGAGLQSHLDRVKVGYLVHLAPEVISMQRASASAPEVISMQKRKERITSN